MPHSPACTDGRLTVVDVADGSYTSRLYDLWFVVTSGSDDNESETFVPPASPTLDVHSLQRRLLADFEAGGPTFSAEERLLIVNALTAKGCSIAEYYLRWASNQALGLAALSWVEAIVEAREVLRRAIDSAAAQAAAE